MNFDLFCKKYNLGCLKKEEKLHGGFMHKMYKVETDIGIYAVKILKRTDDAGAEKLHARQLQEREHRRQRRLNKQE